MKPGGRAAGLLSLCLLVPTAVAGAEPDPTTRVATLPPAAFVPANNSSQYLLRHGGLGVLCPTKGAGYFTAPLQLEDGASIREIAVTLENDSSEGLGVMSLVRHTTEGPELLAITPVSVGSGDAETLASAPIADAAIRNDASSYLLQVMLSAPGVCLRGARVSYRLP